MEGVVESAGPSIVSASASKWLWTVCLPCISFEKALDYISRTI